MADDATLGFLGGTGPLGRGLAARLAQAGHRVLIGSRDQGRAQAAAARIQAAADGAAVEGHTNRRVCTEADVVFVTVPYEAQRSTLEGLAAPIGDKLVVCCVNPLVMDDAGPRPVTVPEGSAAEECQALLPDARVTSAFHHVPPRWLKSGPGRVGVDVLVCGDDDGDRKRVIALAEKIEGIQGVDAGPLRLSGPIEGLAAVLISVNRRYRAHTTLRIEGLPGTPWS